MSQGASTKKKGSNRAGKSDATKDAPLSPRQERFVDEYMVDSNGTQAAIRAGYAKSGADVQAFRLLRNASIIKAIQARRDRIANKFELTRERLIQEYCKLAFSDPRKFFREDGTLKTIPELDDDTAAALAHFEVTQQQTVDFDESGEETPAPTTTSKVKWVDKRAALDSIARVMGWNQDKVKLQGDAENPLTLLLKQVSGTAFTPQGEGAPEED